MLLPQEKYQGGKVADKSERYRSDCWQEIDVGFQQRGKQTEPDKFAHHCRYACTCNLPARDQDQVHHQIEYRDSNRNQWYAPLQIGRHTGSLAELVKECG